MNVRCRAIVALAAAVLSCSFAAMPAAEVRSDRLNFEIRVGGFKVATGSLIAEFEDQGYEIAARVVSDGFLNLFTNYQYDGRVRGKLKKSKLQPDHYWETSSKNDEQASGSITYRKGSPYRIEKSPPSPVGAPRAPISEQTGAIDVLTMVYLIIRDGNENDLCEEEFILYDGTRRSWIELGGRKAEDGKIICDSKFTRVDGFKPSSMEEQVEFPFRLEFRPSQEEDRFQLFRLTAPTKFGTMAVIRK